MILEALNYAASWVITPRRFRPALRYSITLWSRARRCRAAWREHEDNCKRKIGATVATLKRRRTCVILGSGLLRDVPVAPLARLFDTVVLVDIAHIASVRIWLGVKGLRNVRLIHRDLSGMQDLDAGQQPDPLAFLTTVPYLDLVISANILSQIGTGVKRALGEEADTEARVTALLNAHLSGLARLTPPALLLTDTAFTIVSRDGTEDVTDLLPGVAVPQAEDEWTWPVAPLGEISKNYAVRHHVMTHTYNPVRHAASGTRRDDAP